MPAVFFARGDSKVAVLPTPPQHMTSYPVITTVEHAAQHAAESTNVAVNAIVDIKTHTTAEHATQHTAESSVNTTVAV